MNPGVSESKGPVLPSVCLQPTGAPHPSGTSFGVTTSHAMSNGPVDTVALCCTGRGGWPSGRERERQSLPHPPPPLQAERAPGFQDPGQGHVCAGPRPGGPQPSPVVLTRLTLKSTGPAPPAGVHTDQVNRRGAQARSFPLSFSCTNDSHAPALSEVRGSGTTAAAMTQYSTRLRTTTLVSPTWPPTCPPRP